MSSQPSILGASEHMTKKPHPRHIRDIAHLYLSRRQTSAPAVVSILVTAASHECFSGLHVANLAVAFSARKFTVRLYDLSGTLPNASFYLAHPPKLYLGERSWGQEAFHPALCGVSAAVDAVPPPAQDVGDRQSQVHLIHLPSLQAPAMLRERVGEASTVLTPNRWTLVLHDTRGVDLATMEWLRREVEPQRTFTVTVGDPGPPLVPRAEYLGGLGAWKPLVADRVPVVVREPQARASLEYLSVCDSMLSRINRIRRGTLAAQSTEVPTGHPAGG